MSETRTAGVRRRRPDTGGYARGAETRARIVAAALEVFAEEGYARASTRQIAEAAGVTPPALQYHFDSKEGLHAACAQAIAAQVWTAVAPVQASLLAAVAAGDRPATLETLCDFLAELAALFLAGRSAAWGRFLGRAQVDGAGPAAAVMREAVSLRLHARITAAVALLLELPVDSDAARLRASAVLGPLAAFHSAKISTLAALGWSDYEGGHLAAVQAMLRAHTRAALAPQADR